jgi:hypothetical protein
VIVDAPHRLLDLIDSECQRAICRSGYSITLVITDVNQMSYGVG